MGEVARTLQELSIALEGEIPGGFAIIDRTFLDSARPGYRTIELRSNSWDGPLLGGFVEYSETEHPLRFHPSGSVHYSQMVRVVEALRSHGVVIEDPSS